MTINTLMVLLFPFLDSLPFTLPRYWMFRDKLRIPFRFVVVIQLALTAVYSAVFYILNLGGYAAAARWTTITRYSFMLIFLLLAFLLIRDSFPKLMFTYLLVVAWSFFVMGNANFIESRFFWDFSELHPYLVYNLTRVVIYGLTCPFLLHFFNHTIADSLKIEDRKLWRYLWVIPLFSTLFGMLYCTVTDVYAYASWQFLVSRYLMLFGACYVSYVALRVLEISRGRMRLEDELKFADRSLAAQRKQYENLSGHMEATRRARHDLRQHLAVVDGFIERDDKDGLRAYLSEYRAALPLDVAEVYCRNDVVNAIVCCYGDIARQSGILLEAKVGYPDQCAVSDTDAAVLFGNLLENAVEACQRQAEGKPFIRLAVRQAGGGIVVVLDNSFSGEVQRDGEALLSSKRDGAGIGVGSICEIAEKYGGYAEFTDRDGVFSSSVFLRLAAEQALSS